MWMCSLVMSFVYMLLLCVVFQYNKAIWIWIWIWIYKIALRTHEKCWVSIITPHKSINWCHTHRRKGEIGDPHPPLTPIRTRPARTIETRLAPLFVYFRWVTRTGHTGYPLRGTSHAIFIFYKFVPYFMTIFYLLMCPSLLYIFMYSSWLPVLFSCQKSSPVLTRSI